jgi:hypothetical protein
VAAGGGVVLEHEAGIDVDGKGVADSEEAQGEIRAMRGGAANQAAPVIT